MTAATTTKTAPKRTAKTAKTAPKPKVVKAGGAKGARIFEAIVEDKKKALTRRMIADNAGATVGRVGEVVRWLAANGTAAEKKAVAHLVAGATPPKPKAPAKKAAPKRTAKATPKASDLKTEDDVVKAVVEMVEG